MQYPGLEPGSPGSPIPTGVRTRVSWASYPHVTRVNVWCFRVPDFFSGTRDLLNIHLTFPRVPGNHQPFTRDTFGIPQIQKCPSKSLTYAPLLSPVQIHEGGYKFKVLH